MFQIRALNTADLSAVRYVMQTVRDYLVNETWFIPMSDETMDNMFAEESTLTVYGVFAKCILPAFEVIRNGGYHGCYT